MKNIYLHFLFITTSGGCVHSIGFSISYSEVLKFEKCAAVFSVKFDGFVSDSEFG